MHKTQLNYIHGRTTLESVSIPIADCSYINLSISTRTGKSIIDKGDGNPPLSWINPRMIDFYVNSATGATTVSYATVITGSILVYFQKGLKDVYSISLYRKLGAGTTNYGEKYNITDLPAFLKNFSNLFSLRFDFYAYGVDAARATIVGDFAKIPDSLEKLYIRSTDVKNRETAIIFNFNNLSATSKLKMFYKEQGYGGFGQLRFLGDVAKIPSQCNYFYITTGTTQADSAISYTAGKVWPIIFDTLQLPISLTSVEIDNLLIDLNNSVTTSTGGKLISLKGTRTTSSDAAVTGLQSKGFTVTITT